MLFLWASLGPEMDCPACGVAGRWSLHARYEKYHFEDRIPIQRVRCGNCGTTHALIPEFSVPGMSLGREEAERCLRARAQGVSRRSAAAELIERGREIRVGIRLEHHLSTAVERGKAIWPQAADERLDCWSWIAAVCGTGEQPILRMNRYALDHGVNAICFCRVSILLFGVAIRRGHRSHKTESTAGPPAGVAS